MSANETHWTFPAQLDPIVYGAEDQYAAVAIRVGRPIGWEGRRS